MELRIGFREPLSLLAGYVPSDNSKSTIRGLWSDMRSFRL